MIDLKMATKMIQDIRLQLLEMPLHQYDNREEYLELRVALQDLASDLRQGHSAWMATRDNLPV